MEDQSQIRMIEFKTPDDRLMLIQELLDRMAEIAERAASEECSAAQCAALQKELIYIRAEIDCITADYGVAGWPGAHSFWS